MIFILEVSTNKLVEAEILIANDLKFPFKRNGWNFNWIKLSKEKNVEIYVLKLKSNPETIEGIILLKKEAGMLIMDVIEIAPHNIGGHGKKYDYVAGCLIAFGCRESYKIDGEYRGFLIFVSKTQLIDWYVSKYGAEPAIGQRMFISPAKGELLIKEYLYRER